MKTIHLRLSRNAEGQPLIDLDFPPGITVKDAVQASETLQAYLKTGAMEVLKAEGLTEEQASGARLSTMKVSELPKRKPASRIITM